MISTLWKTVHLNLFFIWLNHKTFILVYFLPYSFLFLFFIFYFFVIQKYFWVEFSKICLEWAMFFNANVSFNSIIAFFIFFGNERNWSWKLDLLNKVYLFFVLIDISLTLLLLWFLRIWVCRFFFLNLTNFTFCMISLRCFYIWLVLLRKLSLWLLFLFIQCLF